MNTATSDQLLMIYQACRQLPDDRREHLFALLLRKAEETQCLGGYDTLAEAREAYCRAGRKLHGSYFNAGKLPPRIEEIIDPPRRPSFQRSSRPSSSRPKRETGR